MFEEDDKKRKTLLDELKVYAKTNDIDKLSNKLKTILNGTNDRRILDEILPFLPVEHRNMLKPQILHSNDISSKKMKKFTRTVSQTTSAPLVSNGFEPLFGKRFFFNYFFITVLALEEVESTVKHCILPVRSFHYI